MGYNRFMPKTTWTLSIDGVSHSILLDHGTVRGSRKIFVDGILVESWQQWWDYGSNHTVTVAGKAYTLVIATNGFIYKYYLLQDGQTVPSDQEQKKGKPDKSAIRERIIGDHNFWLELSQALDLPYLEDDQAEILAYRHRLLGYKNGYLVIVRKYTSFQPPADAWLIQVHHATVSTPETSLRLRADKRVQKLMGKLKRAKGFLESDRWDTFIMLPQIKKELAADLAERVQTFLAIMTEYIRPVEAGLCENPDCRQPKTAERRLVLINATPRLLCPDCADSLPFMLSKSEEEYNQLPNNILPGIVAGAGVAALGVLGWAVSALVFPHLAVLVTMLTFLGLIHTTDRLVAKPGLLSRSIELILSLVSSTLGIAAFLFLSAVRRGAPVNIAVFQTALRGVWGSPLLYLVLMINLVFGASFLFQTWSQHRQTYKRTFQPVINILPGVY